MWSAGTATDADVYTGGYQSIFSGGVASATVIDGVGSTYSGGLDWLTTIGISGVQYVYGKSDHAAIAFGHQYVEFGRDRRLR